MERIAIKNRNFARGVPGVLGVGTAFMLLFFTDTVQAGEAEPTTKDEDAAMPDFKNKSWARPKNK